MLSTRLEKAILAGWATYRTFNHAYSSFGSLQIPTGHMAIIVSVKWNHFINPIKNSIASNPITWQQFFKYNEYQLKIDGKKSTNFLQFRNIFDFTITDPTISIDLTQNIDIDIFKKYIFPKASQPIQQNVYFVCEEYINLTLTRNTFLNKIITDFKPLNTVANQNPPPTGLGALNVLTTATAQNTTGAKYTYTPVLYPNAKPVIIPTVSQNMETYTQPIAADSTINDIKSDNDQFINYGTPLLELGVVIFNKNYQDRIMNS